MGLGPGLNVGDYCQVLSQVLPLLKATLKSKLITTAVVVIIWQ